MTDFSTWTRENLERFAADAASQNRTLRADLDTALAGWRWAALSAPAPIMRPEFVDALLRGLGDAS